MKKSIPHSSRRSFLKIGSCAFLATGLRGQQILGANEKVRIGLLGCGGRGKNLLGDFNKLPDVEIVAISDPDTAHMAKALNKLSKILPSDDVSKVKQYQDYRELYEQEDIDAIVIATPNYWHTLHAIQAMEAGKHVYVEKPVSFTPWESIQLEAAELKYGKVIAAGYQNRSDKGPQAGIQYVHEGNLGKIRKVRSLCYRNRSSIGKSDQPVPIPETLDYNLWLGPAEQHIPKRPQLHYDWHWDFRTGNGDLGNQGVHEIDLVCWLLGDPKLPNQIDSFGNRFAWNDSGDTPNMLSSWFNMGDADVILETNDVRLGPDRNVSPNRMGTRVGIIAECENGYLKGGRGGMVALAPDGKTIIERFPGDGGRDHQRNFIDAIKASDASMLNAQIKTATTSASLAHYSNISYRLGELTSSEALKAKVSSNEDLMEIIGDQEQQLAAWGVTDPEYFVGQTVKIQPATGDIISPIVDDNLTGPHYRKGFELTALT